ncbi:MAG: sigma-70 family RNA polymerase sigma factor [Pirellulales bacterium]
MSDDRPEQAGATQPQESSPGGTVPAPLAQLVAEHHAAVYRYAYRLCGSAADAEDVTQQAFLIAHEKLDQVRDADRAGHWLLVVARNVFLKMRRRRVPMPAGGLEIDINSVPDRTSVESAGQDDVDAIDTERLQAAIDELPDEFRVPVLMFYFEEASYRDIAEQLDLPPGTVMSRLSRAKSHLRNRLLAGGRPTPRRIDNGHDTTRLDPTAAKRQFKSS